MSFETPKIQPEKQKQYDSNVSNMVTGSKQREAMHFADRGHDNFAYRNFKLGELTSLDAKFRSQLSLADKAQMWVDKYKGVLTVFAGMPTILATGSYLVGWLGSKTQEISGKLGLNSVVECEAGTTEQGDQECSLSFEIQAPAGEVPTARQLGEIVIQLNDAGIGTDGTVELSVSEESAQTLLQRAGFDVWQFARSASGSEDLGPVSGNSTSTFNVSIEGSTVAIHGVASDEHGNSGLGVLNDSNLELATNRAENVAAAFNQEIDGIGSQNITMTFEEVVLDDTVIEQGIDILTTMGIANPDREILTDMIRSIDAGRFVSEGPGTEQFEDWYQQHMAGERGARVDLEFTLPAQDLDALSQQGDTGFWDSIHMYSAAEVFTVTAISLVAWVSASVIREMKDGQLRNKNAPRLNHTQKIADRMYDMLGFLEGKNKIGSEAAFALRNRVTDLARA